MIHRVDRAAESQMPQPRGAISWSGRLCISTCSHVMPMLLVWGPHFENHHSGRGGGRFSDHLFILILFDLFDLSSALWKMLQRKARGLYIQSCSVQLFPGHTHTSLELFWNSPGVWRVMPAGVTWNALLPVTESPGLIQSGELCLFTAFKK